jgi:regulator of CtrA degradation
VRLDTASASNESNGWSDLPADFRDLVNRSLSLQARVRRVDEEIYGVKASAPVEPRRKSNPVSDQITLLKTAFGRG